MLASGRSSVVSSAGRPCSENSALNGSGNQRTGTLVPESPLIANRFCVQSQPVRIPTHILDHDTVGSRTELAYELTSSRIRCTHNRRVSLDAQSPQRQSKHTLHPDVVKRSRPQTKRLIEYCCLKRSFEQRGPGRRHSNPASPAVRHVRHVR